MNKVDTVRLNYFKELEKYCYSNGVSVNSILKLLEAEKTKKLLKRNALIQQNIDKEIENAIENENN